MLVLFGSYARGYWVEDLPAGYFSDYDLMVIVATEALASDDALWASVSDRAQAIGGRVPVTLLVHDAKQLNQEIRSGQYFFSDGRATVGVPGCGARARRRSRPARSNESRCRLCPPMDGARRGRAAA